MEHPEKSGLSAPIRMPSQENFNPINISDVTVIGRWQTNADSAESQKQIQFGAKLRISSRTKLKEPFGQN
jgi:hypothetical protein